MFSKAELIENLFEVVLKQLEQGVWGNYQVFAHASVLKAGGFREQLFDKRCHIHRRCLRLEALDDLAVTINKKLSKVPLDNLQQAPSLILHVVEDFAGLVAIHLDLFSKVKLGSILAFCKIDDLIGRAWLLRAKLVARKGHDLEALLVVFLMKLDQTLVLRVCQTSLTRHVNEYKNLSFELAEGNAFSSNQALHRNIVDARDGAGLGT